jgi:hypothetical protein
MLLLAVSKRRRYHGTGNAVKKCKYDAQFLLLLPVLQRRDVLVDMKSSAMEHVGFQPSILRDESKSTVISTAFQRHLGGYQGDQRPNFQHTQVPYPLLRWTSIARRRKFGSSSET